MDSKEKNKVVNDKNTNAKEKSDTSIDNKEKKKQSNSQNSSKKQDAEKKSPPTQSNHDTFFYVIIGILSLVVLGLIALNYYTSKNKNSIVENTTNSKEETESTSEVETTKKEESKDEASEEDKNNDSEEKSSDEISLPKEVVKTPTKIVKVKKIEKYGVYYGIIDKNNDPKFARYDGEHAFTLFGDGKMFDTEVYIVPAEDLSNVLLTKQHVYKLYFTDQDIESMTKDEEGIVNVLKRIDHVEDTSLSHVAMGVYYRHAGDEWGPKYESDVYLDLTAYTDDGAIEYVTFIPKTVASPLNLEIGRKYRIGFSYCEQEINDPDIKAYTCSNKAQVLEVK